MQNSQKKHFYYYYSFQAIYLYIFFLSARNINNFKTNPREKTKTTSSVIDLTSEYSAGIPGYYIQISPAFLLLVNTNLCSPHPG